VRAETRKGQGAMRWLRQIGLCVLASMALCMLDAGVAPADGVMAWGSNSDGELGIGNLQRKNAPVTLREPPAPVFGAVDVSAVSAGGVFSLALLENGTVESWGDNTYGELGDGTVGGLSKVPVKVVKLSEATAVAAGSRHGLTVQSEHVFSWGENEVGQLGRSTTEECGIVRCSKEPVEVPGLEGVIAISASGDNSLALLKNGHVWAWGANQYGQLGVGTTTGPEQCGAAKTPCSKKPVEVPGLKEVEQISMGADHALALLKSGEVESWGRNNNGQLCLGTTTNEDEPTTTGLAKVKDVSAGDEFSLALLEHGTVESCGDNKYGQLGDASKEGPEKCSDVPCSVKPVEVTGLAEVTAISAGYTHSLALLKSGTLKAWGENEEGELGTGSFKGPEECPEATPCSRSPVKVSEITRDAVGISAGDEFSLAVGPPGPIITKLKPSSGQLTGEEEVKITGYHFIGVIEVKFGSAKAEIVKVNEPTEIIVKDPPGEIGKVSVTVATSTGSIPVSNDKTFTYVKSGVAPEYGRCVEMAKGKFSNAACTVGSAEGSFEWKPGAEKPGFVIGGGEATLETVGREAVVCKVGGGSGEYSSAKSVASTVIKLIGCTHLGAKCTSPGASEGELVTSTLEGELGWISKISGTVGLALSPESESGPFAEAKCGSTRVEISDSVIGNARTDEMLTEGMLTFEQKAGKQKPVRLMGGEKDVLEMQFAGGLLEQAGLQATVKQVNEERIEVNTSV
jgi:alpha-tubulin suppressor-like RCC1 family protein